MVGDTDGQAHVAYGGIACAPRRDLASTAGLGGASTPHIWPALARTLPARSVSGRTRP